MSLSSVGLPQGGIPLALTAVHGAKYLAALSFAGADYSEEVLYLNTQDGKVKSSNVVRDATEKRAAGPTVSLITGCKNTDGTLHIRQVGKKKENACLS